MDLGISQAEFVQQLMEKRRTRLANEAAAEQVTPKNLREKLVAAMSDVGSVAKEGKNKDQGYSYQRAADIFEAVQNAFAKHKIAFVSDEVELQWPETHETRSGVTVFVCIAKMEYRLIDVVPNGEEITAVHSGIGFDTSDKALNKAKTAALKYFLKQTLLIGEDDDDADDTHIETDAKRTQPACPKCGVVGKIIKGRPEYGGGWLCYAKIGGCGATFPTDPRLTAPVPVAVEPTGEHVDPSTSQEPESNGTAPEPRRRGRPAKAAQTVETTAKAAPSEATGQQTLFSLGQPGADGVEISENDRGWLEQEAKATGAMLDMMIRQFAPDGKITYGALGKMKAILEKRRALMK